MILLIYPRHSPYPHSVTTPLSIFCLGSYLENNCQQEVAYYDQRIQPRGVLGSLLDNKPALAGISAMTCYQITAGLAISRLVKERYPDVPIVWGGVHPSMCPEQTALHPLIDFVVYGEGESTLGELAGRINDTSKWDQIDYSGIDGLVWKQNGSIRVNKERSFIRQLDELPSPYAGKAGEMLELYRRQDVRETFAVQTSRGCKNRCDFCYNEFFNRNILRLKSIEKIAEELRYLKDKGIGEVMFVDDNIGINYERLLSLCRITRDLGMKWSADISMEFLSREMIKVLEDSGCSWLFMGAEAISQKILDQYTNKRLTPALIEEVVRDIAKSKIYPMYSFMIGFPEEEPDYIESVIDFAGRIHSIDPRAEIGVQPYTPFPNTKLYQKAKSLGFIPPDTLEGWAEMTMDRVRTPWIKDKAMYENIYLTSFLAFRRDKFLKSRIFGIFKKIALFRWKKRFFRIEFERILFNIYKKFWSFYYKII